MRFGSYALGSAINFFDMTIASHVYSELAFYFALWPTDISRAFFVCGKCAESTPMSESTTVSPTEIWPPLVDPK